MKYLFRPQVKLLFPPGQAQQLHYLKQHSSLYLWSCLLRRLLHILLTFWFTLSFINVSVLLPSTFAGCLCQELTLTWASAFFEWLKNAAINKHSTLIPTKCAGYSSLPLGMHQLQWLLDKYLTYLLWIFNKLFSSQDAKKRNWITTGKEGHSNKAECQTSRTIEAMSLPKSTAKKICLFTHRDLS